MIDSRYKVGDKVKAFGIPGEVEILSVVQSGTGEHFYDVQMYGGAVVHRLSDETFRVSGECQDSK